MNILVTGAWHDAKEHIGQIEKLGHNVRFMQYEKEALACDYTWVEGVICNGLFLTHQIQNFTNLKYIQLTSAGLDRVPMDYIREKDINIFNARGVYSIPMAEFAVGGVFQLYKKYSLFYYNKNLHKWEKQRDLKELFGKTVCVAGCGSVGTECAKRFKAFGCRVIGVDAVKQNNDNYDELFLTESFEDVIKQADIIVLTLPLTEETHHILDKSMIDKLKPNAVLVNISRGGVVDTQALIEALKENKFLGAVLDVFEEEPLAENCELWNLQNVVITPHNSFVGDGNNNRLNNVIIKNLMSMGEIV